MKKYTYRLSLYRTVGLALFCHGFRPTQIHCVLSWVHFLQPLTQRKLLIINRIRVLGAREYLNLVCSVCFGMSVEEAMGVCECVCVYEICVQGRIGVGLCVGWSTRDDDDETTTRDLNMGRALSWLMFVYKTKNQLALAPPMTVYVLKTGEHTRASVCIYYIHVRTHTLAREHTFVCARHARTHRDIAQSDFSLFDIMHGSSLIHSMRGGFVVIYGESMLFNIIIITPDPKILHLNNLAKNTKKGFCPRRCVGTLILGRPNTAEYVF